MVIKEFVQEPDLKVWVSTWKSKFEEKFPGVELAEPEKMMVEDLECLPTDFEDFIIRSNNYACRKVNITDLE